MKNYITSIDQEEQLCDLLIKYISDLFSKLIKYTKKYKIETVAIPKTIDIYKKCFKFSRKLIKIYIKQLNKIQVYTS